MYKDLLQNIFIALVGTILLTGCGGNSKNVDFDFTTLNLPKKKVSNNVDQLKDVLEEKKEVELKLIPLDKREEILSSIKYGKKDPFAASGNESNQFISNFKLNGFISLQEKDYALVEFQNQKGIININSIGGINTELLPNGTFVEDINSSKEIIKLLIEGKVYTIKLYL